MRKLTFLTILTIICICSFASYQFKPLSNKGIYLTVEDFLSHHLSYENSDKIILNTFFAGSTIKVVIKGESKTIAKNNIYGYHSNNNEDFRFYKNELYQIINSVPFFVYKHYASATVEAGKGNVKKESYFYSVKGTDGLLPLTVANLKKSFADNATFLDLLDQVKNDDELVSYDTYRNQLKIAYLYQKSL